MNEPVITRYCRDCENYLWAGYPVVSALCLTPEAQRNLVNGVAPDCGDVRSVGGVCGPTGKLFKKRVVEPIRVVDGPRPWWRFWS